MPGNILFLKEIIEKVYFGSRRRRTFLHLSYGSANPNISLFLRVGGGGLRVRLIPQAPCPI